MIESGRDQCEDWDRAVDAARDAAPTASPTYDTADPRTTVPGLCPACNPGGADCCDLGVAYSLGGALWNGVGGAL